MTTTTETAPPIAAERGRPRVLTFAIAFLIGAAAVLVLGVAALYAFDQAYAGRILPGVHVGATDLSGLTPAEARARLSTAFAAVGDGSIVVSTPAGPQAIPYSAIGRHANIDAMVDAAVAVGRAGSPLERVIGNAKTALRTVDLDPVSTYDGKALSAAVEKIAAPFDVAPVSAAVVRSDTGFDLRPSSLGQHADRDAVLQAVAPKLATVDAPHELDVTLPVANLDPPVTTAEAISARMVADRIGRDITLVDGSESWVIPAATVRTWIVFTTTSDGEYRAIVDSTGLTPALTDLAKQVLTPAKSASFLIGKSGTVVGVTGGANGRALDVANTAPLVTDALRARAAGLPALSIAPVLTIVKPDLSTDEAQAAAPLMQRISHWTTYFFIGEKNGFGNNIWIPAKLINGYVVAPGATFDFWKAVGPVTREKGYRDGGAIINGKTEPQGALAGGICSCSTTLFNAALRAGFKMGARRNHYYYIDRYPLGLDATVFISASGATQTMSWTNDTKYPVLIRGINTRSGGKGFVTFDLYSVPVNRHVSFSTPIVKNVRRATDTVQYTTTLPPGVRQRIEFPVDGKDVWVTRTVRDASGNVIHQETYYSHYSRITGVTLIGKARSSPSPSPTPSPSG